MIAAVGPEAHRRLLDMLAGWSDLRRGVVSVVENDAVCALYQAAGALDPGTPEQVRAFVAERVVPFLVDGPTEHEP